MAKTRPNDSVQVRPSNNDWTNPTSYGLTKREYFAIRALPIAARETPGRKGKDEVAEIAIDYADALIEQLNE